MNDFALFRFEIPVADVHRAVAFYEAILGVELSISQVLETYAALLPGGHGALIQSPEHRPNDGGVGVMLYLRCEPDLAPVLARVHEAGGTVLMGKTAIGPNGFVAQILDSEGNKIGLHSSR